MADPTIIALLNAAFDEIEQRTGAKIDALASSNGAEAIFVCSGGTSAELPKNIPAIYISQAATIIDWQGHMTAFLTSERAATFKFIEAPKLEKLVMTETGEDGGQRLTAVRYGVTSRIAVLTRKPVAKPKRRKKARKAKPARRKRKL